MDDLKLYGKSAPELESLLNTVRIFSNNISMEFGLEKCATLTIQRGSMLQAEGINLPNNNNIRGLNLEESYKYLGILQADDIKHVQVKKKAASEYTKRARKVLKSKLNGGNSIRAINSWAVPVIRYTAGIVDWTQAELEDLDRKTRKLMTAKPYSTSSERCGQTLLAKTNWWTWTAPSKTDCERRKASTQRLHQKQYRKLSEGSYQRGDSKSARNQKGIPQARNKYQKRKMAR